MGNPINQSVHSGFTFQPLIRCPPPFMYCQARKSSSCERCCPDSARTQAIPRADALGVGHDEYPFTVMGCPVVGRANSCPFRIEPEVVKVSEDSPECSGISNESCDVLHQHVAGSYCAYDVPERGPHPSLVGCAELAAGEAERLAGEAATNNIDRWSRLGSPPLRGCEYVVMAGNLRPVVGQHSRAVGVYLHLAHGGHPGPFEAELDTADAGEHRQDVHRAPVSVAASANPTRANRSARVKGIRVPSKPRRIRMANR